MRLDLSELSPKRRERHRGVTHLPLFLAIFLIDVNEHVALRPSTLQGKQLLSFFALPVFVHGLNKYGLFHFLMAAPQCMTQSPKPKAAHRRVYSGSK